MEPLTNTQINNLNMENISVANNHDKDLCPVHDTELTEGFCEYCQVCYLCK